MKKIKILLVDDQLLFVESLRIVLESRTDVIQVVGIADNGVEAVEMAKRTRPDIILMDVRMPGTDGVEATRIIHSAMPKTKIVMLTTFDNDEYVRNALHHGAVGYLLKNIKPVNLIASIQAVKDGIVQISPSVAEKLLDSGVVVKTGEMGADGSPLSTLIDSLTKREREVLDYLTKAYSNKEIAALMFVSEQTIKNHVSSVYSKLEVTNRMQLMKLVCNLDRKTVLD